MSEDSDKEKPEWEQLEHLILSIQKQLSPDAKVSHNVKLDGVDSGIKRQIDVLVEQGIGQYQMRIVIDCKDYTNPVDVKGVEEFHGLIQDVRAQKGALVCPTGFTKAAKSYAEKLQIDLYSPVDTDPHKWQAKVSIPVLCDFRDTYMSFGIKISTKEPFSMPVDFFNLMVFDEQNNELGSSIQVAQDNWDSGKYSIEPGEHERISIFGDQIVLIDNGHGYESVVTLTLGLFIRRTLYLGHLPIEQIKGLKDEQTGAIVTNAFTTGVLNARDVQENWKILKEGEEPEFKPVFSVVGLDCFGYGT